MKKRIAFVVQRYGEQIAGGAEYHCRVLAEHLTSRYEVDVITTCSISYTPWDNYLKEGVEEKNNVTIHRFSVEKIRDTFRMRSLTAELETEKENAESEWIAELGPYCPGLIEYLKDNWQRYAAIIFFTYAYYPTVEGMKNKFPNAILLPTAHDEPQIYKSLYRKMFKLARAILFNSIEERKFLCRNFLDEKIISRTTCCGIDIPNEKQLGIPERFNIENNYVLYIGRVGGGKNYSQLNKYFLEYKYRNPSDLKLVVAGKFDEGIKVTHSKDIIYTGFVSDEERTALLQNALFLINPSIYESLSLVILESMAVGKPILVNGQCEVMKGQCIRSNAGLYYENFFEFEGAMLYMLNDKVAYNEMCSNGLEFVKRNYSWEFVVENVSSLIEEVALNE